MIDKENCHILIIQKAEYAMLSEAFLKHYGFKNIYTAASSNHALSIIEKRTPDLIFLDYRPIAEDEPTGIELFNRLKKFPALENTPFLIYVVVLFQEDRREIRELGISGLVQRPLTPDELIQACEALLSGGTYFPDWNNG